MAAPGQGMMPLPNQIPVSSVMHHQMGMGPVGMGVPQMGVSSMGGAGMSMGVGPPMQPNPQLPMQTMPMVQNQMPPPETDPIAKFKALLPRLKESLVTLFKNGGCLFYQNASQDEAGSQMDNPGARFEKCLEDFYAICDQIEIYLKLASEVIQQDKDSSRNTPSLVLPQKSDVPQPDGQLYSQYLSTVRAQISCAKDIRDLLHDCLKNFSEHSHP